MSHISEDKKIIHPNRDPEIVFDKFRSRDRGLYLAFAVYLLLALGIMASCNSYSLIGVARYFGTFIPACAVFLLVVSQFSVFPRFSRRALCLVVAGLLLSAFVPLVIATAVSNAVAVAPHLKFPGA